ncbi:MAG: AAA family ATPase [Bacteroidales bacterium]|nr:AAA family ATPase [Bacteroidales bacterium]
MEQLIVLYLRKLASTPTDFFRYLYHKINWTNRLIVIQGAKGVGKTTLVLQHIKETFPDSSKALYVSLDHIWFTSHSLLDLAEYLYTHGGTHMFLDEVHKYQNWEQEVKNIYDYYPDLHIVVTGSSMLQLEKSKADLSRRHIKYELRGLSLREFINLETGLDFPPISLEQLLTSHSQIAVDISQKVKPLLLFEQYLRKGYYPFYRHDGDQFEERLLNVIDTIINVEIPAVSNIEYSTTYKIKRFLAALASDNPYTLNVNDLAKRLEENRNTVMKMIDLVCLAAIMRKLYSKDGISGMAKPEKILFDNTNIIYAFGREKEGSLRETFFASQMSQGHKLLMPQQGDILIDGRWTVEVGGKRKKYKQIADIPNSYVAADHMEIGVGNKIPLWMFGMLY